MENHKKCVVLKIFLSFCLIVDYILAKVLFNHLWASKTAVYLMQSPYQDLVEYVATSNFFIYCGWSIIVLIICIFFKELKLLVNKIIRN